MMRLPAICALLLAMPAALQAQDHSGHQNHAAMGHGEPAPARQDTAPAGPMDGSDGNTDHSQMDHSGHKPQPNLETGPINAADGIWGADAMRQSRDDLYNGHGSGALFWFQADRLEARANGDGQGYLWDAQAYYGSDLSKLWLKSEGEGNFDEPIEDAEVQALFSKAIAPFFDLQAGIRQDLTGPTRTHAVIGLQGVAPYEFEVDGALFLSARGDLTARFEAELDQRITQRLILQPRLEANLSAQDIPELGIGAGLDNLELGLRLRYAFKPEFAPYLGVEHAQKFGRSKDFATASSDDSGVTSVVAGLRFWF